MTGPRANGRSVLVLGGGLAGIAAAVRLAEAGRAVTLVETRKRLGGRATSFVDRQTGGHLDNCQHVLLGCCTNLVDLYRRLGVEDRIAWHDELHFVDKQGHHDVLRAGDAPAPVHLSAAMLRFGTLSWRAKLAIGRAMLAIMRAGADGRARAAGRSFADWLAEQRQPREAIDRFWAVIVISACNQTPERLSAAYALQVFQEGFLAHRRAFVMGVSTVPLVELYDRAATVIEQRGGRVLLGASVERLDFDGERVTGVQLSRGDRLEADLVISALPFDRLAKVAPEELIHADPRLAQLASIEVSPIIGIHLWYDRPVTDLPHLIFVDSPLQWVFRKDDSAFGASEPRVGEAPAATYLHGVISAADDWVGRSADEILDMAHRELAAYAPAAAEARLLRGQVVKEKRATFSAVPGVDALRPETTGPVANLLLAGDWVNTGWPATMEGATRSGYAAAGEVLGRSLLVPDLTPSELYRMLAAG